MAPTTSNHGPHLDGFTYTAFLGGGGFADVYLYRQHLPDRAVAVKVLRSTVDDTDALRAFNAEANSMAKVSAHPNIVTIFAAGVSTDRRPYFVMEYYPAAHFGERIKQGPMRVDKVLEVGIKVASAVETAHRAGIIHRDIKPANVLANDFGEPGLSDFGISATGSSASQESLGYSPPYAPPEIISDTHPGDERSDVFSLAATLWAMLAGHSPFERLGGDNSHGAVMRRVLAGEVPALGRPDVPSSLELALRQALATEPARRPQSAKNFALMLQGVEHELGYRVTSINLADEQRPTGLITPPPTAPPTQMGRVQVVSPDGPGSPTAPPVSPPPATNTTPAGATASPSTDTTTAPRSNDDTFIRTGSPSADTGRRPPDTFVKDRPTPDPELPSEPAAPTEGGVKRLTIIAAVAVVVLVGAVVAVALSGGGGGSDADPAEIEESVDAPALPAPRTNVEPVTSLIGTAGNAGVTFRWSHDGGDDVRFQVTVIGSDDAPATISAREYEVTGDSACIEVIAFIPGVAEAEPVEACS